VKRRVIADAKPPIDEVGTASFIPDSWHETYATADIVESGGVPPVQVGREFLPCRTGTPRRGDGNGDGQP
jgi:nicotinate phosphoribosyltransferase